MKTKAKEQDKNRQATTARKPDTWLLSRDGTALIFMSTESIKMMSQTRLVCRYFAEVGKKIQYDCSTKEKLARIQQNYPTGLVEVLGLPLLSQLPILKIGDCKTFSERIVDSHNGQYTPMMIFSPQKESDTYTAKCFIESDDLDGEPIVRGLDVDGRHFICLNILDLNSNQTSVVTYFQFDPNNQTAWKMCRAQKPTDLQDTLYETLKNTRYPHVGALIQNHTQGNNRTANISRANIDFSQRTQYSLMLFSAPKSVPNHQNPAKFPLLTCPYANENAPKENGKKCIVM